MANAVKTLADAQEAHRQAYERLTQLEARAMELNRLMDATENDEWLPSVPELATQDALDAFRETLRAARDAAHQASVDLWQAQTTKDADI